MIKTELMSKPEELFVRCLTLDARQLPSASVLSS